MQPFNAATWLVDRHVDAGRGDRVALRQDGASISYSALQERINAVAGLLIEHGIRPEERVALVMLDGVDFVTAFLAGMRIGAVPVPINPLLPARDVAAIAADARARVAIVSPEKIDVADEIKAVSDELVDVFTLLGAEPGELDTSYETWADSPGFWLCTSGTTGRPKLAMHRHIDLRTTAEGYAREVLGIAEDDVCFSVAPSFHAYGLGNSLSFPLSVGASAVLEPTRPPTPARVASLVSEERPTLFFCVPTFYAALLASDIGDETFESVRIAVSAGEPLPGEIFLRFRERFGVEILDGIGSTELTHIVISNRNGTARPSSSGTPVRGYDVRIVDDAGATISDSAPGHLQVRGDSAATGYWCRAAASRQTFLGEWVATGDMYERGHEGDYRYLGRYDDMLKVAGEWVSPAEVEAVLSEHDGVLEAAVVGETDDVGLTRPVAYVVAASSPAPDIEMLIDHCRTRLAGYKRPRRYVLVAELPKTTTGKIQRFKLRVAADA